MDTFVHDAKEFQTTIINKLSREGIEHVFSLLTYITMVLHENNDALKKLYVLGEICKVDIDFEIWRLKTSALNADGYLFRIGKLENYLDNEMTKFVASSINKFIVDKNKYDSLKEINKSQFEMTLLLYYPISVEFFELLKKSEIVKDIDIDYLLNSLKYKNNDSNEIINCFFDELSIEENLIEYGYNFKYFDPNLPFYELPYEELAIEDSPFYIIDENHFGLVITNEKFYYEKLSIIHKYSDVLYSYLEKLSLDDRNNIFFVSIFTAYLTSDINKYSINTLKWFLKKEKENVFLNKIFMLIENRTLSEKSIDEILKHINIKCCLIREHPICLALIDTFIVPFAFQDSILKNENINSEIRNRLQKLQNATFLLKDSIIDCEKFHKKHMQIFNTRESIESFNIFWKTNHIRLWFLIQGQAW